MLNKVVAQVREGPLTPEQTQTLATEVLSLNAKEASTTLFRVLNQEPSEDVTTNLVRLFRELTLRSPAWVKIISKSLAKKGRCPRPLVATLRQILRDDSDRVAGTAPSVRRLLADLEKVVVGEKTERYVSGVKIERKTQVFGSGKLRVTVPITTELSDIRRMDAIASVIAEIPEEVNELCLDFSDVDHVYVVGLAALAAWCRKIGLSPQIVGTSQRTEEYLDLIGFSKVSTGGISPYSQSDARYALAMEPILADTKPDTVASRLVGIVDHHMHLSKNQRTGLIVLFAELIENIGRHAAASIALACAQVYPEKHKLTICVVDLGMGIRQSMLSASNEALIQRINQGESAVELACAPLITSKPDKHSGYGLYVATDLIVRNGGTLRVFSGNEILTCYRKGWRRMQNLYIAPQPWHGTWIAMIVDLDATLPIEDVYSTLPPASGAESEDFF
jgi:anti-anti-sigma regulatory factor